LTFKELKTLLDDNGDTFDLSKIKAAVTELETDFTSLQSVITERDQLQADLDTVETMAAELEADLNAIREVVLPSEDETLIGAVKALKATAETLTETREHLTNQILGVREILGDDEKVREALETELADLSLEKLNAKFEIESAVLRDRWKVPRLSTPIGLPTEPQPLTADEIHRYQV
jgi:chromosome segregation ATPase